MGPLQKKWVEELRTAGRRQCFRTLHHVTETHEGFCCLGIAARFVLQCPPDDYRQQSDEGYFIQYDGRSGVLTPKLRERLGLRSGAMEDLSRMNDSGSDFLSIAAYIENNEGEIFYKEV